jgi:hypothetical protein
MDMKQGQSTESLDQSLDGIDEDLKNKLERHRNQSPDWSAKNISQLKDVAIVKIPASNSRPSILSLKIDPIGTNGEPIRVRKKLFITDLEYFTKIAELFINHHEKLQKIMIHIIMLNKQAIEQEVDEI